MAKSRTNGGGRQSTSSLHLALAPSDDLSTNQLNAGDGQAGGISIDALKKGDTLRSYLHCSGYLQAREEGR